MDMYHAFVKAFGIDPETPIGKGSVTLEGYHPVTEGFYDRDPYGDYGDYMFELDWWYHNWPELVGEDYEHLPQSEKISRANPQLGWAEKDEGDYARRGIDDQGSHYKRTQDQNRIRVARADTPPARWTTSGWRR